MTDNTQQARAASIPDAAIEAAARSCTIRVYRRDPHDRRGFLDSRPWNVAGIPEDMGRETCYETWGDAMAWVNTPPEQRARIINDELKMEGT